MWGWIWDNKEWLFSGGGISIILLAFFLFKLWARYRSQHNKQPATVVSILDPPKEVSSESKSISSSEYSEHPNPVEIDEAINKLPPFQQEAAKQNYQGLKVQWHVTLSSVSTTYKSNSIVRLSCF
jgi:hypothetical protein